ncbi:MAG: hypothetical protein ACYCWW_15545 [Deltaproteobacteria bacterium]
MRALLLLAALVALPAQATTLLVPDFRDRGDPSEGIRTRSEIVRALGAYPQISIAPLFKFKRLAKRYRLRRLDDARAASTLGRREGIDGLLAGQIRGRGGLGVVHLVLFDPSGTPLFSEDVPVSDGEIPLDEGSRLARRVAESLGLRPAPPSGAAEPSATAPGASAPPAWMAHPPSSATNAPTQPRPASSEPPPYVSSERDETEAPPPTDPLVAFGLFVPFALRNFDLNGKGQPIVHFGTDVPYSGIGGDLELFPLHAKGLYLRGLGLVARGSIGFLTSSFSDQNGNTVSFPSQDLRFDADLTYRLSLADVTGTPYVPGVALRVGYALFDFQVSPSNPADLQTVSRSAVKLGLEAFELVGPALRLSAGAHLYLDPTPGAAMTAVYGTAQSSGFGLDLLATGRLGLTAVPGLGYEAGFSVDSFQDKYAGNGTNGPGIDSGDESYVTFWLGLKYAL